MIKRIAQALGFSAILLLPNYIDLIASAGDERMRSPMPLTQIVLAQLTDLAIVAFAFFCLLAALRRTRLWSKLRWALMALLPAFLLVHTLDVYPFHPPVLAVRIAGLIWIGLLLLLIWCAPSFAAKLSQFASAILAGFALFALVVTLQMARVAFWHPGPQSFATPIPSAPASRPRIIWIIFDELAYKQLFESRDPSLHLPNFDRLRSESTLYTDVKPIDSWTIHVIPSLKSGQLVTDINYNMNNRLLIKSADSPQWHQFDAGTSLIGMANQHGMTTSIVGWYLPSCPVYAGTATECYWSNYDAEDRGPMWSHASFVENVWFPLRILIERYFAPAKAWTDIAALNSTSHIASVKDASKHALQTIAGSNADLIYIHLPVPHPAAFWNRHTSTFDSGGSYLDSLDYSDRLLGQILDLLEAQPRWTSTSLIVQGDHSWRTWMWRTEPGWSAEDERISHGGQWDSRPALIIHTAGELSGTSVNTPTSILYVHSFIAGQIQAMAR
jgi:Sulfatase